MSAELTVFQFEQQRVRSIIENGEPLFVAADVCAVLELSNVSQALSRLDEDERRDIILNDVTGRKQSTAAVNESGLYSLILSSRKPEAKAFKKWVTAEVLPSIRRTGTYTLQKEPSATATVDERLQWMRQTITIMEAQQAQLADHEDRLARVESRQTAMEEGAGYFTVLGYINYCKLPTIDFPTAQGIGRKATRLSNERGVHIGKATDPRFGEVNTYHESILDAVMRGRKGGTNG